MCDVRFRKAKNVDKYDGEGRENWITDYQNGAHCLIDASSIFSHSLIPYIDYTTYSFLIPSPAAIESRHTFYPSHPAAHLTPHFVSLFLSNRDKSRARWKMLRIFSRRERGITSISLLFLIIRERVPRLPWCPKASMCPLSSFSLIPLLPNSFYPAVGSPILIPIVLTLSPSKPLDSVLLALILVPFYLSLSSQFVYTCIPDASFPLCIHLSLSFSSVPCARAYRWVLSALGSGAA